MYLYTWYIYSMGNLDTFGVGIDLVASFGVARCIGGNVIVMFNVHG